MAQIPIYPDVRGQVAMVAVSDSDMQKYLRDGE